MTSLRRLIPLLEDICYAKVHLVPVDSSSIECTALSFCSPWPRVNLSSDDLREAAEGSFFNKGSAIAKPAIHRNIERCQPTGLSLQLIAGAVEHNLVQRDSRMW